MTVRKDPQAAMEPACGRGKSLLDRRDSQCEGPELGVLQVWLRRSGRPVELAVFLLRFREMVLVLKKTRRKSFQTISRYNSEIGGPILTDRLL